MLSPRGQLARHAEARTRPGCCPAGFPVVTSRAMTPPEQRAPEALHRAFAVALATAAAVMMVTFVVPGGGVVFTLLAGAFPVGLIVFGAARRGRLGPIAPTIWALLVIIEGTLVGMLVLRGAVVEGPWLFGLPLAAALQLFGLFLLPLLVVSFGYARTFSNATLDDDELAELRRRFGS